jgi:hypothetical protein
MITALQAQKINAANLLVESRAALFTASNTAFFSDKDARELRAAVAKIDEVLSRLVTNDIPKESK